MRYSCVRSQPAAPAAPAPTLEETVGKMDTRVTALDEKVCAHVLGALFVGVLLFVLVEFIVLAACPAVSSFTVILQYNLECY